MILTAYVPRNDNSPSRSKAKVPWALTYGCTMLSKAYETALLSVLKASQPPELLLTFSIPAWAFMA